MNIHQLILIDEIDFALAEAGIASYSELRVTLISAKEYLVRERGCSTGAVAERINALLVRIILVLDQNSGFNEGGRRS